MSQSAEVLVNVEMDVEILIPVEMETQADPAVEIDFTLNCDKV